MKIFCIGRNYTAHAKEMGGDVPTIPMVFMKPATALLPYGKTFYYPDFSKEIHYELELVVEIKTPGKSIPKEQALNYVGRVTVGIDFTARDLQRQCKQKGHPWEVAKSFDHSAALGKWKTIDVSKLHNQTITLHKNGIAVQNSSTSLMIFDIATLISFISDRFTLQCGDLIYTGTPEGVGEIESGDLLEGFLNNDKILVTDIK